MGSSVKPSGCSVWCLCTWPQQEGRKPIVGHGYVSVYTLNSLDSEVFIQAPLPTANLTSEEDGGGGTGRREEKRSVVT